MADEQQAYTLSDRATYLARTLEGTDLEIMVEGDPILFNPYGVMAVNPDKNSEINNELANEFIDWLVSMPAQEMISRYLHPTRKPGAGRRAVVKSQLVTWP